MSGWPFWFTLGGKLSTESSASTALTIVTSVLCVVIVVGLIRVAYQWWAIRKAAVCPAVRQPILELFGLFLLIALSGYLLRAVMFVVPCWAVYLVTLLGTVWVVWGYAWWPLIVMVRRADLASSALKHLDAYLLAHADTPGTELIRKAADQLRLAKQPKGGL